MLLYPSLITLATPYNYLRAEANDHNENHEKKKNAGRNAKKKEGTYLLN